MIGIILLILFLLIPAGIAIYNEVKGLPYYNLMRLPNGDYQYIDPKFPFICTANHKDFQEMVIIYKALKKNPQFTCSDEDRVQFYKDFNELPHMNL